MQRTTRPSSPKKNLPRHKDVARAKKEMEEELQQEERERKAIEKLKKEQQQKRVRDAQSRRNKFIIVPRQKGVVLTFVPSPRDSYWRLWKKYCCD